MVGRRLFAGAAVTSRERTDHIRTFNRRCATVTTRMNVGIFVFTETVSRNVTTLGRAIVHPASKNYSVTNQKLSDETGVKDVFLLSTNPASQG